MAANLQAGPLMYLHIEERHRVPLGTYLHAGDPIGHPSCEGGRRNRDTRSILPVNIMENGSLQMA